KKKTTAKKKTAAKKKTTAKKKTAAKKKTTAKKKTAAKKKTTAKKKTAAKKTAKKSTAKKKTTAKKTAKKSTAKKKATAKKTAKKKTTAKTTAKKTPSSRSAKKTSAARKKAAAKQRDEVAETSLQRIQDPREVLLHDALRSQRTQDLAAAERYLERFIEDYPKDVRGLIFLADMKLTLGNREAAEPLYKTALRKDKTNSLAQWSMAMYYLDGKTPDLSKAEDLLKKLLKANSGSKTAEAREWTAKAKDRLSYCESRRLAFESRKALSRKGGPTPKALRSARDLLKKALAAYPKDPRNHMNLGSLKLQLGDAEGAVELCESALEHDPTYARAYLVLGKALLKQGKLQAARTALLQCIEHDEQQRDLAESWHLRRHIEQELAQTRRLCYETLTQRMSEDGSRPPLSLAQLKEWIAVLEGVDIQHADLTLDPHGGYTVTGFGARDTFRASPGPEGLVLERV
ncbi:MAG: tetratricopeptide repeat protein, partial [Planctomycetes bacterium]|nr:tetratricopeptide repeat protein [Planctomycetota bacterium]